MFASLNRIVDKMIHPFPGAVEVVTLAESFPFLNLKLKEGFISSEEWTEVKTQFLWRHKERLDNKLVGPIRKKTRDWLFLLLLLSSLLMALVFFLYFCTLFRVVFAPELIAEWVGHSVQETRYDFLLKGRPLSFSVYSTDFAILKVSLMLSVFVALAANVHSLTDSSATERLTSWLREKARIWIALGSLYDGIICPNYQVWHVNQDKKRGLVNASIVVPRGSNDAEVKEACEHFENRLNPRRFVHITAYEQNLNEPVYETWVTGKRWQYLHNKANNFTSFDPMWISDEDISSQCFLGRESLQSEQEIPDEWFGNDPIAVSISKSIWDSDTDHEWVLHPSTLITDNGTFLEVLLTKKMGTSEQYKSFLKNLMTLVITKQALASNVTITLSFRDTGATLASVWWFNQLTYVNYSDQFLRKPRYEKTALWIKRDTS